MGAYHARKLRPTATVYAEVTRCRVATVKLSRRRYLKKRPRIAVFSPLCVPHHTQGSCCGECNSARAAVHERNKQEKSLPKKAAQERTHQWETHPKQQRGAAPNTKTSRHPETQTGTKKGLESSLFTHFHPRRFLQSASTRRC